MDCKCWMHEPEEVKKDSWGQPFAPRPRDDQILATHFMSVEQACDRAYTVGKTMCGLYARYDRRTDQSIRSGPALKWARVCDGELATCTVCLDAESWAASMGLPAKERAR